MRYRHAVPETIGIPDPEHAQNLGPVGNVINRVDAAGEVKAVTIALGRREVRDIAARIPLFAVNLPAGGGVRPDGPVRGP